MIIVVIIAVSAVLYYLNYKKTHISTDDAFVEGKIYSISSRVPGTILHVYVDDNQFVRKGEVLVELDPLFWHAAEHHRSQAAISYRECLDPPGGRRAVPEGQVTVRLRVGRAIRLLHSCSSLE